MSPSPFSVSSPTNPSSYSWEATDESVAQRFGIPVEQVLRFDLNTSPAPPAMLARLLAAGRFETSLSEYPPGDYRRLLEAASAAYGVGFNEIVPGAGADEILDMCTKAFLPAGQAAAILQRRATDEERQEFQEDYTERLLNPYVAAERGYVDAVIDPAETRREVAAALQMLENKRELLPRRKHGNTPL